jgi:hypothetical protein
MGLDYHSTTTLSTEKELNQGKKPLPRASWDSVLECAAWELDRAKVMGDKKRITALGKTIKAARQHIQCGDAFPIGPFSIGGAC